LGQVKLIHYQQLKLKWHQWKLLDLKGSIYWKLATSFAEIPRKLLHIRSTISKTIVGFKSSIKTSKDCKKAKCLSCGDIKVARGIPIIPIAVWYIWFWFTLQVII